MTTSPPPDPESIAYPPYGADPYGHGRFGAPPVRLRNGLGLAGMVLGIMGVLVFWIPVVGLVLGILAVVFGVVGIGRAKQGLATNRGQALAGLALGAVAVVGTVVFWVWAYNATRDCINRYDVNTPAYEQCVRDKVRGDG